jgi:predicted transposase YbfD/YdcC
MLGLISYGLICGAPDVKSIWRKCGALDENQRRAMGLIKRSKATGRLTMPGYDAINDLINKIAPKSMSEAINNWFPLSRQLLSLKRRFTDVKSGKVSEETRHFITSLEENERRPKDLARNIREHWSVEHKNHWRRDTCRWKEDKTSTRNPKVAKNLALLRGALFALIPFHEHDSLNGAMDHYSNHPWQALSLVNKSRLINH